MTIRLFSVCATVLLVTACDRSKKPDHEAPDGVKPPAQDAATSFLTTQELLDPQSCQGCHPSQYDEWAGSMHAYASRDPVFLAMNARGQAETDGKLGDFCVQCHAPMAVREGLTTDGLNLPELDQAYQGVTCYFCHSVDSVDGVHNNPLGLPHDGVMRGPFDDPAPNTAHASAYSTHFDAQHTDSARMCGACHDVALGEPLVDTPVLLERSYVEWQATLFSKPASEGGLTCNGCHMPISSMRDQSVPGEGFPKRRSRRHDFEGVDVALEPGFATERQRLLVQQFLDSSLLAEICVSRDGIVAVTLENAGAGHHWPSGASHDRIAWLDVAAYDESGLAYRTAEPEPALTPAGLGDAGHGQASLSPDASLADAGGSPATPWSVGPALVLTDHVVDAQGQPAHFFWEVAAVEDSTTLPGLVTRDPLAPDFHKERGIWEIDTRQAGFDTLQRVELTVRIRPIKLAILGELVASGHLALDTALAVPTFSLVPDRCHTDAEVQQHADILIGAHTECDPAAAQHTTTLIWERDQAQDGNRNFRQTVVRGAAALCLAHPTYIPPP